MRIQAQQQKCYEVTGQNPTPPTLTKHCMCTVIIFVVNDHGKQIILNFKVESKKISVAIVLSCQFLF